jgi:hypothetical protein
MSHQQGQPPLQHREPYHGPGPVLPAPVPLPVACARADETVSRTKLISVVRSGGRIMGDLWGER